MIETVALIAGASGAAMSLLAAATGLWASRRSRSKVRLKDGELEIDVSDLSPEEVAALKKRLETMIEPKADPMLRER